MGNPGTGGREGRSSLVLGEFLGEARGSLERRVQAALQRGGHLLPCPVTVQLGKANQWEQFPQGLLAVGGELSHLSNNHILEMLLVIPVQGLVAFIWEAGPGEKGGRVFHKISLGIQGLASHQGMSERHWA